MLNRFLLFLFVVIAAQGRETFSDFATQIDSTFDGIRQSMMSKVHSGFKSGAFVKSRSQKSSASSYSATGFIYLNVHLDTSSGSTASCSTPVSLVSGVSVDYCKAGSNDEYFYKYQVTTDSCKGAVIEYFDDPDCTNLLGTTDLGEYDGTCEPVYDTEKFDRVVYQAIQCSTSESPIIPTDAFLKNYYVGTNCGRPIVAYDGFGAETCLEFRSTQTVYIDCSDSEAPVAKVYGANCKGSIFSTADLIVTCENNLEDDDHYLGPYLDPPTSTTRNRNRHLTSSVPSAHTPTSSERTANNAETNENSVSAKKGRISPLVADSISTRSFCMVQEEETSNEPSKGILAAIIIGCIVGAALVVAFLYYKIFMEEPPEVPVDLEMNHLIYYSQQQLEGPNTPPALAGQGQRPAGSRAPQGTSPPKRSAGSAALSAPSKQQSNKASSASVSSGSQEHGQQKAGRK